MQPTESDTNKKRLTAKQKKALKVLAENLGVVTQTCEEAKISRSTFYEWKNENVEFARAVEDVQEIAIDFVENKLFERVQEKSDTAIIFYLKTKGKNRGYIERTEIQADIKGNLEVSITDKINKIYGDSTDGDG